MGIGSAIIGLRDYYLKIGISHQGIHFLDGKIDGVIQLGYGKPSPTQIAKQCLEISLELK
jgi:hypothetical protein